MTEPLHPQSGCALLAPHPTGQVALTPARREDLEAIFQLIDEASRTTTVLPRTRESILEKIEGFVLARDDSGQIVACGAIHVMGEGLVEIRSLVVAAGMRGQGIGAEVVHALVTVARRRGFRRLFTLTDAPGFFARLGFTVVDKATLPQKVWNDCIFCPKFNDCGETALDLNLAEWTASA